MTNDLSSFDSAAVSRSIAANENPFPFDPALAKTDGFARDGFVEYVPVIWLLQYVSPGWTLARAQDLAESAAADGYRQSLIIGVGQRDRRVELSEGRNRLIAAVINGRSHVPARVSRVQEVGDRGLRCHAMSRLPENEYFSADSRPSQVFDQGFIPDVPFTIGRQIVRDREIPGSGEREPDLSREI